ncbi:hypothetical protein EJ06DRAFT_236636 [Trichodelitschia bisporula]|uniref:Uncharacterized protein n=1 Tax=Trichodelitschia bisporula TaxID=703511 RepID=A0A6G1HKE1_9PEZI|nr:hypothetical protein EJ06DRAFT_236636 [Trichodelitschia bisporula]
MPNARPFVPLIKVKERGLVLIRGTFQTPETPEEQIRSRFPIPRPRSLHQYQVPSSMLPKLLTPPSKRPPALSPLQCFPNPSLHPRPPPVTPIRNYIINIAIPNAPRNAALAATATLPASLFCPAGCA